MAPCKPTWENGPGNQEDARFEELDEMDFGWMHWMTLTLQLQYTFAHVKVRSDLKKNLWEKAVCHKKGKDWTGLTKSMAFVQH